MRRSLLVILLVAGLSGWIGHLERGAVAGAQTVAWVRTADGWQPRRVLQPMSAAPTPQIHPALVGAFQLGVSALALLAFPARVTGATAEVRPQAPLRRRQRAAVVTSVAG